MNYRDRNFMCVSLKELPIEERPREKMEKEGSSAMSNLELLCVLLGSCNSNNRVQDVAQRVLDYICSKPESELTVKEMAGIDGMGKASALKILSALEIGRRFTPAVRRYFRSPSDIFSAISHFDDSMQEHFICIMLNGAYEIIEKRVITTGLINRTVVHPREVFAPAIERRAVAIIIAHNHPSGHLEPSQEDFEVTSRIKSAGDLLGINVLDHIIFCTDSYHSMAESGEFYFQ